MKLYKQKKDVHYKTVLIWRALRSEVAICLTKTWPPELCPSLLSSIKFLSFWGRSFSTISCFGRGWCSYTAWPHKNATSIPTPYNMRDARILYTTLLPLSNTYHGPNQFTMLNWCEMLNCKFKKLLYTNPPTPPTNQIIKQRKSFPTINVIHFGPRLILLEI